MKTFNTMLTLKRDWRFNSQEFMKLLNHFLQNDITPEGANSPPMDIDSETCKELFWDVWEFVANTHNPEPMKIDKLCKLWDEIAESLPEPEAFESVPYLLNIERTSDNLCVHFKMHTI